MGGVRVWVGPQAVGNGAGEPWVWQGSPQSAKWLSEPAARGQAEDAPAGSVMLQPGEGRLAGEGTERSL